jgi:hypothetical protein
MVWIVENMMNDGDWIDCVDTWEGGEEHVEEHMEEAEQRFDYNVERAIHASRIEQRRPEMSLGHTSYYGLNKHGDSVRLYKYKCRSTEHLSSKLSHCVDCKDLYSFIYIDGSHTAPDVLTDACMAWPVLKPKGLMVFDDYMWGNPRDALHRPKIAIDAFTNIFGETAEIIHVGYQLVVRKKGE